MDEFRATTLPRVMFFLIGCMFCWIDWYNGSIPSFSELSRFDGKMGRIVEYTGRHNEGVIFTLANHSEQFSYDTIAGNNAFIKDVLHHGKASLTLWVGEPEERFGWWVRNIYQLDANAYPVQVYDEIESNYRLNSKFLRIFGVLFIFASLFLTLFKIRIKPRR